MFPHEHGHFSVVIVRPTADESLTLLRHRDAFDAACRAIPGLDDWTEPGLAVPTSGVLVGGRLRNIYRPQRGRPGLVAVGDSVATTAPTAGRGVAMASIQIHALLGLLDGGADPVAVAEPFGSWCDEWIRPWVDDHLAIDSEAVRRWRGHDVDLTQPLTSAAIVAAAQADPRIATHLAGYVAMTALPASLAPAEPLARAVYESGWRLPYSEGPTRDQLVDLLEPRPRNRRRGPTPPRCSAPDRELASDPRLNESRNPSHQEPNSMPETGGWASSSWHGVAPPHAPGLDPWAPLDAVTTTMNAT